MSPTSYPSGRQYKGGLPDRMIYDPWIKGTEIKVWACIAANSRDLESELSAKEIGDWLGLSYWTVHRSISKLIQAGYLVRIGEGPSTKRRLVIK